MKIKKIILSVILLFIGLFSLNIRVQADDLETFYAFDVRTKNSKDVTEEKYNEVFGESYLKGKYSAFKESSEKNGMNMAFSLGQLISENGWTGDTNNVKNNNIGNLRGKGDDGSYYNGNNDPWQKWSTLEKGIQAYFESAHAIAYKGVATESNQAGSPQPLVKDYIETYAPAFENDHNYIMSVITSVMKRLGQPLSNADGTMDGSTSATEDGKEDTYENGDKVGDKAENYEWMVASQLKRNNLGAVDEDGVLDTKTLAKLKGWSSALEEKGIWLLFASGAILILFTASVLAMYIGLGNGWIAPNTFAKFTLMSEDSITGKNVKWKLLGRVFVVWLIIGLVLGQFYVDIVAQILIWISKFVN